MDNNLDLLEELEARVREASISRFETLEYIHNFKLYRFKSDTWANYLWDTFGITVSWWDAEKSAVKYMRAAADQGIELKNRSAARVCASVTKALEKILDDAAVAVLQTAQRQAGYGNQVTAQHIRAAGTVLTDAIIARKVSDGNGGMIALDAAVAEEYEETHNRQLQHIHDSQKARGWSDIVSILDGQEYVVNRDDIMVFVRVVPKTLDAPQYCVNVRYQIKPVLEKEYVHTI